jgi:4-hydroxythreonine-4-phosphate dehydrogenase
MTLPLLLTMGDPVGIGPEIIVRAHADGALHDVLVVGDPAVLARAQAACGLPTAELPVWLPPDLQDAGLATLPWGQVDARAGAAAAACIIAATREVLAGRARAVVTAPIHKEALAAAGLGVPGHTELLQALASEHVGRPLPVRMMLANDELRVVLVTIHTSLRLAIDALDTPGILETIVITHEALQRFGIAAPRIAVAGLNPHAGEGGLFGDEEIRLITPAIEAARSRGIDARGPYAPDTVFMRARQGEFDVVVAMYHDQGLIPVKLLGLDHGVNTTLGLPMIRTSPDHGTAFDIAGTGRASASSLLAAVDAALRMSDTTTP